MAFLWLDLKNVYGSIPHKLVEESLKRHHVTAQIIETIVDYYNNFKMRTATGNTISAYHRLERGIITGCTISDILFSSAINMIIKAAEIEYGGPLTRSGHMNDMTITSSSVIGAKWLLKGLEKLILWARMSFNVAKSRSLVLKKGLNIRAGSF